MDGKNIPGAPVVLTLQEYKHLSKTETLSLPDFSGALHTLVMPTAVAARITSQPRLPPFSIQWYWTDHGPEYVMQSVDFEAQILYEDHGRRDRSRILKQNNTNSLLGHFDFGGDILGGIFECSSWVNWRRTTDGATGRTAEGKGQWAILGDNPTKANIRALLPELPLQVVAYKESRFRQFDNASLPLFGPPNGFGAMQIDTPPATARQLWDWRQNVAAGISLYRRKQREVTQHFTNTCRAHPEAPQLTRDQLKLALYQYYNGGFYWEWDVKNLAWKTTGNVAYGDDSLRIEQLVASGRPPADWN